MNILHLQFTGTNTKNIDDLKTELQLKIVNSNIPGLGVNEEKMAFPSLPSYQG